ncbi:MAG: hypothetical protein K1W22_10475 [Lachnospiraceae bacterium]|nr:hypothetical protein C804_06500 [Lachnospiraceae bacterium A4]
MGNRESSFHIGDGFNGKGKKVYITASTYKTYEPLSQENVRLTPSFRYYVQRAQGAMPLMNNAGKTGSGDFVKAVGAMAGVGQVIVKKDAGTGKYQMDFVVNTKRLTNGGYLYKSKRKK